MRALAAFLALLAACDFVDHNERIPFDAGASGGDGGGDPACAAWELVAGEATALAMMDTPPYDTARSARVAVTTELGACDTRAMPEVAIDPESLTATITLPVWRQVEGECGGTGGEITRPVVMQLPDIGTWTITAEGAEPLAVKVDPGPGGQCGNAGEECRRDCDCDAGEVCLRGSGIGGPFTACAIACELDRDCGGQGICVDVADGLDRVCRPGDECNQEGNPACPGGYSCDVDADNCTPDFALGQEARRPCDCDADCTEPLRCVRGRPEAEARCQLTCQTGGPWCEGAHFCGLADQDVSGLATTDSVCVWAGE